MQIVIHPKVLSDVRVITEYHRTVAGPELAEEFYRKLRQLIIRAAERPGTFAMREQGCAALTFPAFLPISCSE